MRATSSESSGAIRPRSSVPNPATGSVALATMVLATVVLDTSVLVADPAVIHRLHACHIVVPLVVVEELDGHKDRRDDVGRAAREALRQLERIRVSNGGTIATAAALPSGSTIRVEMNGVHHDLIDASGLDIHKNDNRILAACLGLRDALPSAMPAVRLLSNDTALRIKASQLGLEAAEYVAVDTQALESGAWPVAEVGDDVLGDVCRAGGAADVLRVPELESLDTNTCAVLRCGTSSVLVRRRGDALEELPRNIEAFGLRPRSKEQRAALALLMDPDVALVALDGVAGTGKTVLALAAGLEQVVERRPVYERVSVYRPVVSVGNADLGYLPGSLDEKLEPWMTAIVDAVAALTDERSHRAAQRTIDELVQRGQLTLDSVTYLRGRTLHSSFVIVDEAQNLELSTVKTILTRAGEGTKIVFCGDRDQIDAPYLSRDNNGLALLLDRFRGQDCFGGIRLVAGERSDLAALAASLLS